MTDTPTIDRTAQPKTGNGRNYREPLIFFRSEPPDYVRKKAKIIKKSIDLMGYLPREGGVFREYHDKIREISRRHNFDGDSIIRIIGGW